MKKNITKVDLAKKLRKEATQAEKILWEELRKRKCHNLKFRRQHPLKEFIVDFFNYELNLVVEVDGGYHDQREQQEKDALRDLKLEALGYRVLRVKNETVIYSVSKVLEKIGAIKKEVLEDDNHLSSVLSSRRGSDDAKSTEGKSDAFNAPSPSKEKAGMRMKTVLSTKTLTKPQRELILNTGIGLVEYDAIKIEFINFKAPKQIENAIFTSQNAVTSVIENKVFPLLEERTKVRCYCVGEKTAKAATDLGFSVSEVAENASELAKTLIEKHSYKEFVFLCGNKRRDELPQLLRANYTKVEEIEVYKTTLNPKRFERNFDAVLFFSPSGVQSYFEINSNITSSAVEMQQKDQASKRFSTALELTTVVCIGPTTASEAKKYTDDIVIANSTSVESVIAKAVKVLKN